MQPPVTSAAGCHGLEQVLLCRHSGEESDLHVRGLFYGIGHKPNSGIVAGQVELDEAGYVKVVNGAETNVKGVFAAGLAPHSQAPRDAFSPPPPQNSVSDSPHAAI